MQSVVSSECCVCGGRTRPVSAQTMLASEDQSAVTCNPDQSPDLHSTLERTVFSYTNIFKPQQKSEGEAVVPNRSEDFLSELCLAATNYFDREGRIGKCIMRPRHNIALYRVSKIKQNQKEYSMIYQL